MKVKTSELIGPALDWAVAKCEGATHLWHDTVATWWVDFNGEPKALSSGWSQRQSWHPSTNWSQGGPLIERENMSIIYLYDKWGAGVNELTNQYGPTPLIAAMRCYVASKLGEVVDVPEELI